MPYRLKHCHTTTRQQQARAACGFTLIELLVVVSIIALLIAILLPVLGKTRESARSIQCLANQKQMMAGWFSAMAENKGQIPNIMPSSDPNRVLWYELLADQYPGIQRLQSADSAEPGNPFLCPTIDVSFGRPLYAPRYFGFTVNARWSDCGPLGENELRPWAGIPQPSDYPWFADPLVQGATSYGTGKIFGDATDVDYGLGFYHGSETGNAVFADGHAESYAKTDLAAKGDDCGTPLWLLAQK